MYYAQFDAQGERVTSIVEGVHFNDEIELQKYLDDGFIEISLEDQELYATNSYIRDAETGRPIVRPPYVPPIAELADTTWQSIKAARDVAEQSGCPYMGHKLDSDQLSVQRISIAVEAAQGAMAESVEGFALNWTMQDNAVLTMTAEQVVGMSMALAAYSNSLHEQARVLRGQIDQIAADFAAGAMIESEARSALNSIKFDV